MQGAHHEGKRGMRLEAEARESRLTFHEAARSRRAAMRAIRRGGCAQDRPQGAAEGEVGEIEEALRLLGRSGDEDRQLRVAILASFYPDLHRFAVALLIEAREKAGLSQAELAAAFGLPEQLVVSYESGARLLDVGEFVAFCRAIGADPCQVLTHAESAVNSDPHG
jgi:DNA-binding XRE family transcriptional regulator